MKKTKIVSVLGLLTLILLMLPVKSFAAGVPQQHITAASFRTLDQHGEWIHDQKFGRVWHPHVVAGWRPFLYGDWVWADASWYWDSYEPFGWLTYHYGNWYNVNGEGWIWIPGYDWSAAQVQWIDYDDYIGWAPLLPAGFFWPDPWDFGPMIVWNVCTHQDFHRHDVDQHLVQKDQLRKPEDTSRIQRNAPDDKRIATASHSKIEKVTINHKSIQDGSHTFKQPQFSKEHLQRTAPYRDRVNREILAPRASHLAGPKKH